MQHAVVNTLFDISTLAEMKTRQVMCYAQIFNFTSKFGSLESKFGRKIKYFSVAHHLPRFHFSESRYVKQSIVFVANALNGRNPQIVFPGGIRISRASVYLNYRTHWLSLILMLIGRSLREHQQRTVVSSLHYFIRRIYIYHTMYCQKGKLLWCTHCRSQQQK